MASFNYRKITLVKKCSNLIEKLLNAKSYIYYGHEGLRGMQYTKIAPILSEHLN